MKRLLSITLVLVMLLCGISFASETEEKTPEELMAVIEELTLQYEDVLKKNEELTKQVEELTLELESLKKENETEETVEEVVEPAEYEELARGAKGEAVKVLQQRLKDLGYLTGSVDGDFGGGTERAVSAFQNQNKLPVTGVADADTQALLHSEEAEKAIVYESLDYKGVSRNPDSFIGRHVKFSGKVLQVIEYFDYDLVSFRVATSGNYDNVVYVTMAVPENYSRILEEDRIEVSGTYGDLYSYETVRGDTVTIPLVYAELITLK